MRKGGAGRGGAWRGGAWEGMTFLFVNALRRVISDLYFFSQLKNI